MTLLALFQIRPRSVHRFRTLSTRDGTGVLPSRIPTVQPNSQIIRRKRTPQCNCTELIGMIPTIPRTGRQKQRQIHRVCDKGIALYYLHFRRRDRNAAGRVGTGLRGGRGATYLCLRARPSACRRGPSRCVHARPVAVSVRAGRPMAVAKQVRHGLKHDQPGRHYQHSRIVSIKSCSSSHPTKDTPGAEKIPPNRPIF